MATILNDLGVVFPDATTQTTAATGTGALIGYQVFTSSGTYTKATNNPSFVIVEVVGGGGGTGTSSNGGTSSFGQHCSATGGSTAGFGFGGDGGIGSGGDINSTGGKGIRAQWATGSTVSYTFSVSGGDSQIIGYGGGVYVGLSSSTGSIIGGGGGGYSRKKILEGSLSSSETVTVGAAGSGTTNSVRNAQAGIVIVWEFK
jgi:hypothetical protein